MKQALSVLCNSKRIYWYRMHFPFKNTFKVSLPTLKIESQNKYIILSKQMAHTTIIKDPTSIIMFVVQRLMVPQCVAFKNIGTNQKVLTIKSNSRELKL